MGEVYRATDSKLGREVAIKVLPAAFIEDAERLARFEREARVLAALEHPHIAGIYGLEEVDGKQLLVMQLALGENLAARLDRGPLPLDVALPIARQIAEALEAAHERGIVHRDLKPANVMVARDGAVKVLDFGLAKAWDDGGAADAQLTMSPTLTAQMTQAGVILGTAGYMSPEQARGQEADRRADIWSFGVVLHEMLTGQRLFQADTVSDTLARVLLAEPDWEAVETDLPAPIAALLRRCLERDVGRRLQAIGEARIAIEDYLSQPAQAPVSEVATSGSESPVRAAVLPRVALWLVLGAAAGWGTSYLVSRDSSVAETPPVLRFAIQRPKGEVFVTEDVNGVDISRDGRQIAFVAAAPDRAEPMIYLKTAEEAEPRVLPTTEGARHPFFSPNGEWLGYFTDRELRKISLLGGASMALTATADRRGAVWHPDGTIYFVPHSAGPLVKMPATGGEIAPVTTLDAERGERTHRWPSLLPDGKAILYTSDTFESTEYYDDARIEVVDLATGEQKVVLENSSRAVWSASGHLLFARDGSLFAVPFDPEKRQVTGTPRLALQGVSTVVASGAVQFALSDDGSIAYIPGGKTTEVFDLVWLSRQGGRQQASGELGQYSQVALAPAGDRAVVTSSGQVTRELWVVDMERETLSRLTFVGSTDPVWSRDGKTIFFGSARDGTNGKIYSKPADGSGDAELVWDSPDEVSPSDLSPNGRFLLVETQTTTRAGIAAIWIIDLTGEREPYEFLGSVDGYASFSPDGNRIAYISSESGRPQVYVRPFPSGEGKWQISSVTAREPRWSPDGKRLYYRTSDGIKYVELDLTDGFRAGRPQLLEPGPMGSPFNMTYSISPDSERLLVLRPYVPEGQNWRIHVVLNWRTELERLLGGPSSSR